MLPAASQWYTPTSANLGLGDDTVSAPLPLGFAFPYPGGTTTDVQMSSNGFVRLVAGGNSECCAGSVQLFLDRARASRPDPQRGEAAAAARSLPARP